MSTIDTTLAERGSRYGEFTGHAKITQDLKRAMVASPKWATLRDDQWFMKYRNAATSWKA